MPTCAGAVSRIEACASSFDLLRFQPYSLIVHKYALALVRLWLPPSSYVSCELCYVVLVGTFEQNSGWLGYRCFYTFWHTKFNWMCESELQRDKLLPRIFRLLRDSTVFKRGSIANPYHSQDTDVAFRDTGYRILKVGSNRS